VKSYYPGGGRWHVGFSIDTSISALQGTRWRIFYSDPIRLKMEALLSQVKPPKNLRKKMK